jgi:Na+/melibiose symporter-like transporter
MSASRSTVRQVVASVGLTMAAVTLTSSSAGASSRQAIAIATTSSNDGALLLALGGAVLVLGGIGFVMFTWSRRKRRPVQCAEQREALELAERAVQYWQAARTHLEVTERTHVDTPSEGPSHASLVAKAEAGLKSAMQERDQRQLELIHCMASGPAMPVMPTLQPQPFFTPGAEGTPPSTPPLPPQA